MRLSKTEIAHRLGVSERSLSAWQAEGMPIAQRGKRGQSNVYDVAAVVQWIKATGRGIERGPLNLETTLKALELELGMSTKPAAQAAANDIITYTLEHGVIPLAARLMNAFGFRVELAIGVINEVADVLITTLADRYEDIEDDFCVELDKKLEPFYRPDDPCRPQLIDAIHKTAAEERNAYAPQLPLEDAQR